jgi:hypothetical protein
LETFGYAFDAAGRVTALGALFAALVGLASSAHCFAMCGPLACAGCARAVTRHERLRVLGAYQVARIAAYSGLGALLGAVGGRSARALELTTPGWLPWLMAALLVASALGLTERVPQIPPLAQITRRVGRRSATFAPVARAAVLGGLTPFLPCGLLYGLWATALVSGSGAGGALLAGGFALGAVPALAFAQLGAGWLRSLPAAPALLIRRGVPLLAAGVLVWRALALPAAGHCH